MKIAQTLVVASFIAASGVGVAWADGAGSASETLGQKLQKHEINQRQFHELILKTGLTPQEAKSKTLNDVVEMRWQIADLLGGWTRGVVSSPASYHA